MATTIHIALAALDDLPARGQTVTGDTAKAYRCARRLLQPEGGLLDVIEPEDGVEWPEETYTSLDLRDYLGRDVSTAELAELKAKAEAALSEEEIVEDVSVSVTFAAGSLSLTADIDGAEGPFSFVLAISDVTSTATLQVT